MRAMTRARRGVLVALVALVGPLVLAAPAGAAESIGGCMAEVQAEEEFAPLQPQAGEEPAADWYEFRDQRGLESGTAEYEELNELWEEREAAFERCQDAPNPLIPEIYEVIWGAVGFAVVFFFIWKYGYPAIKQGMANRVERIENDLAAAESQRTEAETLLTDYRAQLADARNESARIIEEARQQADTLKRDQEARLQSELNEMRDRATADIEAAKTQAVADLRGEVAALAVGAAEVVVKRNLDQPSQVQLIEDYINQVTAADG
jgi:F-type H+-transporting ATPase subunit b